MEAKISLCDPRLVLAWAENSKRVSVTHVNSDSFVSLLSSRMEKFHLPSRDMSRPAIVKLVGGVRVILTSTLRTHAEQAALYAQGRSDLAVVNKLRKDAKMSPISLKENREVTWTKVSKHNPNRFGLSQAFDIAFVRGTKLDWDKMLFGVFACLVAEKNKQIVWGAEIVRKDGKLLNDFPHFEVL